MRHRVLARHLQRPLLPVYEVKRYTMRQLLAVEVRCVRDLELGEMEALGGDIVVNVGVLGCREQEVASVVDLENAAFPKLERSVSLTFRNKSDEVSLPVSQGTGR